jgi:AcrR family transcriptional regulator
MRGEEPGVRDRIVLAAIECIEREGVAGATIRSIAREAGVNSAAISYYFRSKDRLLEEALERTRREGSSEMLEELAEAGAATGDPRLALREILVQQFLGATRYPRITQWHLHEPLAGKATGASARYWTEFFELFFQRVRPLLAPGTGEEQRLSVVQLWSALILPGMMPGFFSEFAGVDLRGEEAAGRYVDRLLEGILREEGRGKREE